MPNKHEQFSIAVLDDYQGVALSMADWSVLEGRASTATRNASIDVKASSIRSRCRLIIPSGACRTCWQLRTLATFRAASTSASIRTRSTT